ncbi:MAG: amidase [Alphaproteobacteria bacterium]|nr:amidase [Alphaproteobacteria bacterium]
MARHMLTSSPTTVHWGAFDAALPPVLEIDSGDTVTIEAVSGAPDVMPERRFAVLPELREIHARVRPIMFGHILTGPVAVRGVKAGEVLEVRIKDVRLRQNWGWNIIRPLMGTLPEDFPDRRLMHIALDEAAMVARPPWGIDIPLRPFFGVIGLAPPPAWGAITSIIPRAHGGNMDIKELVPGTILYLPVFNDGARFSVGDGHAAQGDGEVCLTAIETSLAGTFELIARPDLHLAMPRAETPTHYITMGFDPDLDDAAKQALRDMIGMITERTNLSREDAYSLCSLAADLRVSQLVNVHKGVHVMLPKAVLHG